MGLHTHLILNLKIIPVSIKSVSIFPSFSVKENCSTYNANENAESGPTTHPPSALLKIPFSMHSMHPRI